MSSKSIHVVAGVRTSFLFKAEYYSIVRMDHIWFIHSPDDGHLGCFHLLVIVGDATIKMGIQISLLDPASTDFKYIARASLVVQWLRIRLPMQGTRVRALVWEDPTCRGATRPVSHNC